MLGGRRKGRPWEPRLGQPSIGRNAEEPTPAPPTASDPARDLPDDLHSEPGPTVEAPVQPPTAGDGGQDDGLRSAEPVEQPVVTWHRRHGDPPPHRPATPVTAAVVDRTPAPGHHPLSGPLAEVCGGSCVNTRGGENQDRWQAGAGPAGAWLIVADGISGGPHGAPAAQSAVSIANSVLVASDLDEASLYRAYDVVHAALWPWYVNEVPGGTTLTIAVASAEGVFVAAIGDSPAYADDGSGLAMVTDLAPPGGLREWLGSRDVPQPTVRWWSAAKEVITLIVASDGIDPATIYALAPARRAAQGVAQALAAPSVGGDDATIAIACLTWAPATLAGSASVTTPWADDQFPASGTRAGLHDKERHRG